ncbi:heparinase II/III domain-containing protein [Exilibacterium tricleocarpae]|nr:heparinase II/III family protein [Exilibacterium tricleocarpae]
MSHDTLFPLTTAKRLNNLGQAGRGEGVIARSIKLLSNRLEPHLQQTVQIPGQGEAGSYAHNRHKENARLIEGTGLLYQLTQNPVYAEFAGQWLLGYAKQYLHMDFHPQKNTNPPGRLFHQILNEQIWLLFASLGYGYIKETLPGEQRETIEQGLFYPMLHLFTETYRHDFDRIHNHGLWAVAAVGISALTVGEEKYVDLAVDGQAGDRESGGFLAQISRLFSPSGYYVEGPYYHRFAIHPLCLFAEALHLHRPELDIYNYKDRVIHKTIQALLATAYPNGDFPALNDASRTMNIQDEGVVTAVALGYSHYGHSDTLTAVAQRQGRIWLHPCAQTLAQQVDTLKEQQPIHWPSIELNEGPDGNRGAQGYLRLQNARGDLSQVTMNYGQHGMDHGHFDTLGITLFNRDQEVLREYGFGRWVNVESKFGGRYLPQNHSWARQTVAHNCVVVDQLCQNNAEADRADQVHGQPHFFIGQGNAQAMSAFANHHFRDIGMQRTALLISLPELDFPVLIDLYRLSSRQAHLYDYVLHYAGQIMQTNIDYSYDKEQRSLLGSNNGYQHLFQVAKGDVTNGLKLTWLQNKSFYTWLSASTAAELIFAQTGANDPEFNLRTENCLLLRKNAGDTLFASAFETHGHFDEASEYCAGATGALERIEVLGHTAQGSVVRLTGKDIHMTIMVSNAPGVTPKTQNIVEVENDTYHWQGFFAITDNNVAGV